MSGVPLKSIVRFELGSFDMFKKFVSNALLSVVVDKTARDKISLARGRKTTPTPNGDNLSIPSTTLRKEDDPKALIHEALSSAEEELGHRQKPTYKGKPITPERAALIEQAMAIRRSKLYVLDELTQDQRDKLTHMAIQALNDQTDK